MARCEWLGSRPLVSALTGHFMGMSPGKPRPALDEPVRVNVTLVAARPQRLRRRRDPDGRIPRAVGKPDADNAAKLVMDALVKAMVLRDDTLVCVLHVERWYAGRDEGAATEVVVSTWRDGAEGAG